MNRQPDSHLTDLDVLLAPIPGDNPCGLWLRYDARYDQARKARREEDAGLPQGVWQTEVKRADWAEVEMLCGEALATSTKDLQLAVWLLEAWIQLDGFSGAARGLELILGLSKLFWDGMYPALGNDPAPRLAPIQWANDKLSRRLRQVRLTHPTMEGVPAYSLADWEIAVRNPGAAANGALTMTKFQQSVQLTPYEWFQSVHESVLRTIEQVQIFDLLIDEKAGALAPGLLQMRDIANSAAELLESMLAATRKPEIAIRSEASPQALAPSHETEIDLLPHANRTEASMADDQESGSYGFTLHTREDAYRLLGEIAAFLRDNDPHSPTPYLIERAIVWGGMTFDELLPELVRDQGELSSIVKLLRLSQTAENSSK